MTTLHFGLPVEQHGLYEWRVYEPSLHEVIVPLPFRRDTSETADELAGTLDPRVLAPGPTFYEQLPASVRSLVAEPTGIGGAYDRLATTGARRVSFTDLGEGLGRLVDAFDDDPALRYAFLYWEKIDTVDHLDAIWPPLTELLTQRAAGSARDVFLHVAPGETDHVVDELGARLAERAEVVHGRTLFRDPGPRLLARLGDVAVLPAPGRQAWLAATPSVETWMRGMHGGRTSAETATYLAEVTV